MHTLIFVKLRRLFAHFAMLLVLTFHFTSADAAPQILSHEEKETLLQQTFDVMNNHYIDPAIIPAVEQTIRHRMAAGQYTGIDTLQDFANTIGGDIHALADDDHLSLYTVEPDQAVTHILTHPTGKLTHNFGIEQVKYLYGNVGYLKFYKFHPDERAKDVIDAAFRFLQQSDGLIIDLRDTMGGSPQLVHFMLSHFLAPDTPLWEVKGREGEVMSTHRALADASIVRFRPDLPVWLLTSHNTASASELFAGVLQAANRAILVGEQTAGAGFYVGVRPVTDSLIFRISLSKPVISANGTNWEKTGLHPDINVPAVDALAHALRLKTNVM